MRAKPKHQFNKLARRKAPTVRWFWSKTPPPFDGRVRGSVAQCFGTPRRAQCSAAPVQTYGVPIEHSVRASRRLAFLWGSPGAAHLRFVPEIGRSETSSGRTLRRICRSERRRRSGREGNLMHDRGLPVWSPSQYHTCGLILANTGFLIGLHRLKMILSSIQKQ